MKKETKNGGKKMQLAESVWVGGRSNRVTIWWCGGDPYTGYHPGTHDISQKHALELLAEDGVHESCYVKTHNSRTAGEPMPKSAKSAARFAKKAGLPFRDHVWFPRRASHEEAEKDIALEPELAGLAVEFMGQHWRDDNTWGDVFQVQYKPWTNA
jgi:hypothetical protein